MHFDWPYFWHQLLEPSGAFIQGLWLTILLAVAGQVMGMVLGLPMALARRSSLRALQYPARAYIHLFRGTPLLVQIIFIYTGLAAAHILRFQDWHFGPFTISGNVQAGILALGLNEAAYMAEIFRAGLEAVDRGQTEAAKSLGMRPILVLRHVVLPQALRIVLLPIGNQFNLMLKNTTLVSVIGVSEMLLVTETINSATFRTFELFSVLAIYFLILTTAWGFVLAAIERRMTRSERERSVTRRQAPTGALSEVAP